ncbi:hypothetical protein Tco_0214220 [Tanacetum coccineum]
MASLDHRLNPLFSIKECMSCGALYTRNCGCSKGSLEYKILNNSNQTIDDSQDFAKCSFPTCNSGDENSFTYDSKPNSVDDSPNVFNPPPQPPMYFCEFYGNDARYGHYWQRTSICDMLAERRILQVLTIFENIEYVEASPLNSEYDSLEEVNEEQEEKEFDLEDILQIQDIEPDQGGLISVVIYDDSKEPLLEPPEFESFHFDLYDDPSFPRPPPEPPDVEFSLIIEIDAPVINNVDELNEDDDSFTFVIRTFLPFLTYPEVSPLLFSTKNEDTIFDPGIST